MANQALIKPGSIVWDPFVGTGSIIVAAAHYGAHVYGSDIDYRVLHGTFKGIPLFYSFFKIIIILFIF